MKEIDKLLQGGWEGLMFTCWSLFAAMLVGVLLYPTRLTPDYVSKR
jgi:hypothetical protein